MSPKGWNRKMLALFAGSCTLTLFSYFIIMMTISFQHNNRYIKTLKGLWSFRKNYSEVLRNKDLLIRDGDFKVLHQDLKDTQKRRLPKCLIIGFSKCGTTALRGFLSLHPKIVSPLREMRFFTSNYNKGLEWYRNQMPLSSVDQVTVEKSAGYITSQESLKRIYQMDSGLKLVVTVRDPIVRLQSEYARCMSGKTFKIGKTPTFKSWCGSSHSAKVLKLIDYATSLRNVYRFFPKSQVFVTSEELLEKRPIDVLKQLETFLRIEPSFSESDLVYNKVKGFYCFNTSSTKFSKASTIIVLNERTGCLGNRKGRAHPEIESEFLRELIKVARPYNQRLFRFIGKEFSWVNFQEP